MNLNSARKRWRLVFWSHGGTCRRMEIFGLLFFPNFMEANKGCGEKWRGRNGKKMSLGVGEYFLWILACCGDIFPSFVPGSARHFPLFRWHGVKTERKTEKGKKERFGTKI